MYMLHKNTYFELNNKPIKLTVNIVKTPRVYSYLVGVPCSIRPRTSLGRPARGHRTTDRGRRPHPAEVQQPIINIII